MPSTIPLRRTCGCRPTLLVLSAVLGLACSSGSTPPPTPPAIGATGGTVSDGSGASVVVPPGALAADTVIRIARDSTGAPALPTGLNAAGATYVVTPHGGDFAQPVEVRIPAPGVTLQPNQELKLAKAQPGGDWLVLGDSQLTDGVLSAQVSSFSYFVPVTITYILPLAQQAPLQVSTSLDCGDQGCGAAIGRVTATYTVTTNSGALPANCVNGNLKTMAGLGSTFYAGTGSSPIPLSGATLSRTLNPQPSPYNFVVGLSCGTFSRGFGRSFVTWLILGYPQLAVRPPPPQLDLVDGLGGDLEVVLVGGASEVNSTGQFIKLPTPADRATVDWQRSDDGGGSWRTIARSYQDEANPNPLGSGYAWRYWSVHHGFITSATDQGALIRVQACYTPPDVAAPPCVTGPATRLNVLQQSALPSFSISPRSVLVTAGQTASFSATAGGAPAPTLQWQTRAANDTGPWADVGSGTGGTTGSYTTAALTLADNGRQYRVVASNALGSAESAAVTASVSDLDVAPTITTQPASLAVTASSDAAFAIAARGTEALGYQWRLDGTPITGATGPVLRLAAVTAGNAGGYSVVVSNAAGSVASDTAILTVTPGAPGPVAPTIVTQPAAVVVDAGNTATFAVGVSGTGPLTFQWRKGGADVAGATSAAITLVGVAAGDAGLYSVVVGNVAGNVTSADATLAVTTTPPPVVTPPSISTQPSTLVVAPGAAATLAVAASGSGPLAYQWSLEGTPVAGATGPVLAIASVGASEAGSYTVTISNGAGIVTSLPATLILVGAPVITTQPAAASVIEASTATFSVTATGAALRYQWLRNGVMVAGATGSSHTTLATALADSGSVYSVLVYNGAGLVLSQPAVLTVTAAPVVTGPAQAGKLAASYRHTCAVLADSTLACWGYNSSGQIGTGNYSSWPTPYVLPLTGVTAVAAGQNGTCAVHGAGDLSCWGTAGNSNVPVTIAGFTGVLGVTVGASHACLVSSGGSVYCWGNNTANQLGDGTTTNSSVPVQVQGAVGLPLTGVVALSASFATTCALKGDQTVMCWGSAFGSIAAPVAGLTGITALSAGGGQPCALASDGTVRCWSATSLPVVVAGLAGVTALTGGSQHYCAVLGDGSTWCWGTAPMGNGNVSETQPTPKQVAGLANVGVVAAGLEHTCALRTDRTLTCWGANSEYQLGTGDKYPRLTPTDLAGGAIWSP
jgi:Regulator of chromosome condensation (RCC1) repeat/Immunoglobulin I-set domain/ZU5 domain